MKVYLDTNVFIYLCHQDPFLSEEEWRFLDDHLASDQVDVFYSPLTILELGCHLNDGEKKKYGHYREIVQKLRVLSNDARNLLSDPDETISEILGGDFEASWTPKFLQTLVLMIAKSNSYRELTRGGLPFFRVRGDLGQKYPLNQGKLLEWLDMRKNHWVQDLTHYVKDLAPDAERLVSEGKAVKVTKEVRKNELEKLDSNTFGFEIIKALAVKTNAPIPSLPTDTAGAEDAISAFLEAFRGLLKQIITGRNYSKHVNDLADLYLLSHLADEDLYYITNDRKFINFVPENNPQRQRIILLKDAPLFLGMHA